VSGPRGGGSGSRAGRLLASGGVAAWRRRRGAVGVLAGLLATTLAVGLLAGATHTVAARLTRTVDVAYRPAYDLVVRPPASVTALERRRGLVRDDFLSDLFGGISEAQLAAIRAVPGVVAAPVENVGYVLAQASVPIPLPLEPHGPAEQLLAVKVDFQVGDGGARFTDGTQYVYVDRAGGFTLTSGAEAVVRQRLGSGHSVVVCGSQSEPPDYYSLAASPYTNQELVGITCYAPSQPGESFLQVPDVYVTFNIPVLVSAVDPAAEQELLGFDRAIVHGRPLSTRARATLVRNTNLGTVLEIPVVASTTSFLDERLVATTELLQTPARTSIPERLAAPDAYEWVTGLPGRVVARMVLPGSAAWKQVLGSAVADPTGGSLSVPQYWEAGQPHYTVASARRVVVAPVTVPASIWRATPGLGSSNAFGSGGPGPGSFLAAPPGNTGQGVVSLTVRDLGLGRAATATTPDASPASLPLRVLDVVGQFDPARLDRFSPLSRVPLQTFFPPDATPANAAAREAFGSGPLGPTTDLAGYVAPPPELLTTLPLARALVGPAYPGSPGRRPIAAVLVRLSAPLQPGTASERLLAATATAIRRRTGLSVTVVDGSSPTPIQVELPPGAPGAAAPLLSEGWVRTGVAVQVLPVLDAHTLGLLGLTSGLASGYAALWAYLGRRQRRATRRLLRDVGWTGREVATALGAEAAATCLGVGVAGAVATALVSVVLSWPLSLLSVGAPLALGALAALLTGLVVLAGGLTDGRGRPPRVPRRARRRASLVGFALVQARARLVESLAGAVLFGAALAGFAGLAAGGAGFARHLNATQTLLGAALSGRALATEWLALGSCLAVGALGVLSLVLAAARERSRAFGVLQGLGWGRRDLVGLVVTEAAVVVVAGLAIGTGGVALWALLGHRGVASLLRASAPFAAAATACVLVGVGLSTGRRARRGLEGGVRPT